MTAPCLILIGWQQGFRELEYWGQRNNPDAEKNAERLLAHWRSQAWPVIHVAHSSTEENSILRPGHPGHEFEDFAEPLNREPIYLTSVGSAFTGTSLAHDLRSRGWQALVFCGVTTDQSVSNSVRMAANLGFAATLAADACFTFERMETDGRLVDAQTVHDITLASLNGELARIATTAGLIRG